MFFKNVFTARNLFPQSMYNNVTGKLILKFEKQQRLSLYRALTVLTVLN